MVTGASTADVAVILIDATRAADGKLLPRPRHSTIARLLGIRHIVVAVNKMDLVDWDLAVFERIRAAYAELAAKLGIAHFDALPLSGGRRQRGHVVAEDALVPGPTAAGAVGGAGCAE